MTANQPANIATKALDYIQPGMTVGLGTGRAATAFIETLGQKVQGGMKLRGVPTSEASATLARQLGIPLTTLDDVELLDVAVDGADEVDPECNLIKGYGGALVREKIIAACAKRFIVLVGDEKLVSKLGSRGKLPVEAIPFGLAATVRHLQSIGLMPVQRQAGGQPYVTDNGNYILDCVTGPIDDAAVLERKILSIPGVVGSGLFLGMASVVLIQRGGQIELRTRASA